MNDATCLRCHIAIPALDTCHITCALCDGALCFVCCAYTYRCEDALYERLDRKSSTALRSATSRTFDAMDKERG